MIDPIQSKSDARLIAESPRAFMNVLLATPGLEARARIAGAVAEMPLDTLKAIATKFEKFGLGRGQRSLDLQAALLERWSELDAEGLVEATCMQPSTLFASISMPYAFGKLAAVDPEAAWRRAQDLGTHTFFAKQAVLQALAQQDPEKAIDLVKSDRSNGDNSTVFGDLMQAWVARDPESALQAYAAMPADETRANMTWRIANSLSSISPDMALSFSRNLTNAAEREVFVNQALTTIAREDPQRALGMLDDPLLRAQRRGVLSDAVSAWARQDFSAALAYGMKLKSPADQQQVLLSLNVVATKEQRVQMMEIAKSLPPSAAKEIYKSAFLSSLWVDGADPAKFLQQVPTPGLREELLKGALAGGYGDSAEVLKNLFNQLQPASQSTQQASQIAAKMAGSHPGEALKWVDQLEAPDLKSAALKAALKTWSDTDPQAASQKALEIENPTQRAELLRTIALTWAKNDDASALQWAQTLAGPDRAAALGAMVQNSLLADPRQAQDLYSKFAASLDPEAAATADNKGVARSVAATLTENDPQQAIVWAGSLPPGGAQNEAYAGIVEKWAGYDPVTASEWVGSLPAGEGRDLAADKLVASIARDDPDSAWAWATSIGDAAKRREAAARVLQAWKGYGKVDQARAALAAAGFSAGDVKELSRKLE